jgi:antitoxin MazE
LATTAIARWGNSKGVRLSKLVLETAGLRESDMVDVTAENGRIVIKKASGRRRSISEIFDGFEGGYDRETYDWGKPMGDEAW